MKKQKPLQFHWTQEKAARNEEKYGVSFNEAASIFKDRAALYLDDVEHSQKEKREIVIGRSSNRRLLTCFFTRVDDVIHLIGARISTHRERQDYEDNSDDKTKILYKVK